MSEIEYKPNMTVVRTCRAFIRSLCETYGHTQGMAVWDRVRESLGDRAAGDIMFGMLVNSDELVVSETGPNFINVIKAVRLLTGWGLKEAKDFCDRVRDNGPQRINTANYNEDAINAFVEDIRRNGGIVE